MSVDAGRRLAQTARHRRASVAVGAVDVKCCLSQPLLLLLLKVDVPSSSDVIDSGAGRDVRRTSHTLRGWIHRL